MEASLEAATFQDLLVGGIALPSALLCDAQGVANQDAWQAPGRCLLHESYRSPLTALMVVGGGMLVLLLLALPLVQPVAVAASLGIRAAASAT